MKRRVVITGLGTVNPVGNNLKEFWAGIQNSKSGIGKLTKIDASKYASKVAAEVKNFDAGAILGKKEVKRMDPYACYAMVAAIEAMEDANLKPENVDSSRFGVILGNGVGGITTIEQNIHKTIERKDPLSVEPLLIPKIIPNIGPGMIAIRFNANGPCYNVSTACSSGADAAGAAAAWIENGMTDVMITGGAEAPICDISWGGFSVLQTLAAGFNDQPERSSRPFDKNRCGFVMGEGAGILILEELEHAKKRGAKIYAEWAGYGCTCDANHLTAPHPEGKGGIAAVKMALASANLKPEDIDYINAHGTSTEVNDPIETKVIKEVFGAHARKLKMSSTKSMTGHLLGGAGGIEAVISVMAIHDQFFPPTINYEEPDPACDLDYVPNKGYKGTIRAVLSNSFGFGGHNAILCFKQYKG